MFIKRIARRITVCVPILILAFFVRLTNAQIFQPPTHTVYDYFDAPKIPIVNQRLQAVERYHLTKGVIDNIANGKYKFALGDIDFTLRYFPNHPMGLHLLTTVAALMKNRALPIRYFDKAIALYPNHAITHAQYGWFLVTIGDLDNGIQKLNYAIQMDSKLIASYVWLAQAYENKGDLQLAREARDRAKELGFTGKLADPGK